MSVFFKNFLIEFFTQREQIQQKSEKRQRTKTYKVVRSASGFWFPITHGLKVFCCPPCSDEPRISLRFDDIVYVTRWRKYWLFGEKQCSASNGEESLHRIRGWFPRTCVVEIMEDNRNEQKKKK